MKKVLDLIFVGVVLFLMSMIVMVSVSAEEQYIKKEFVFPGYSPVVSIDHSAYDWTLEMRDDGTLKWSKNRDRNNQKQLFDILPTSEAGYFVIREHTYEHSQRVLTYTPDGFVMAYPATDEYGMQTFSRSQMFRFKWVNNRWRLVCAENNICFCNGGWGTVRLFWVNA